MTTTNDHDSVTDTVPGPSPTRLRRPVVSAAAPALLGIVLGLVMPRGPLTSAQSLAALALAIVVGFASGWLLGSRWAALLGPVAFAAAFEITRWAETGPTVDAIRLDRGIWGAVAFISGRGFDALVILLPLAISALWGAALARRQSSPDRRRGVGVLVRRTGLAVASVGILGLAVLLARPASTPEILQADGSPVPGSIAELSTVDVGGVSQALLLRGRDSHAPVLLFLEGGPGGTAMGAMHYSGRALEEHFVVATWDQRGTGKSVTARDPVSGLTPEQAVQDTIAVAEHLRTRFAQERIYVVGSSWGSTLGVMAVQARPDLFAAYIGSGQMVDQQETDRRMYDESLAYAQRVGDSGFAQQLRDIGRPPYTDLLAYPIALSSNPDWNDYPRGPDYSRQASYPTSLFASEYTFTESMRAMGAMADTFAAMYPQLQDVDFRRDVRRLEVPVYLVEGVHEAAGRADLADDWFAGLSAPSKHLVRFGNSGHTPHLDEPARFADYLADVVLPQTSTPEGSGPP